MYAYWNIYFQYAILQAISLWDKPDTHPGFVIATVNRSFGGYCAGLLPFTLRVSQDFSPMGHLAELKSMGCTRFIADLSHCGAMSTKGKQVLTACGADQPLPETTNFNYQRGLA
jgi:hypothetical protein